MVKNVYEYESDEIVIFMIFKNVIKWIICIFICIIIIIIYVIWF